MRVLYTVTDDWYFLSHRLPLARAARDAGAEVVVVTAPGSRGHEIEQEGFRHRVLTFHRTKASQPLNLLTLRRLQRIYEEERPDLVHHVSFVPILYGSLAARRAGIGAVVNAVTGLGHAFVEGPWTRSALRWAVERAYKVAFRAGTPLALFQNEDDRRHFVERRLVRADRCAVVRGSGVDVERFRPLPGPESGSSVPRVLHSSRMLWTKGVGQSVEASRILRRRGVEHRLVLAGRLHPSNPGAIPRSRLEAWVSEGIATWVGHSEDVPGLLRESSVVCLPTAYREGIPMSLLEACASGKPIVTTDVPGCREAVADGVNGILVPVGRPELVADALERLLGDAELRGRMGAAGRERALERFSKEIVVEESLACYARVLRESGSTAAPGAWAGSTSLGDETIVGETPTGTR